MSDITLIKLGNTTYDLKDSTARTDAAAAADDAAAAMAAAATAGATATWGSVSGTISDQTDLTIYINQLISQGASGMLGRINFNGAISFTSSWKKSRTGNPTIVTYTVPSNGYVQLTSKTISGGSTSSTPVYVNINGTHIATESTSAGTATGSLINNATGIGSYLPVSQGDIIAADGGSNVGTQMYDFVVTVSGTFYPPATN